MKNGNVSLLFFLACGSSICATEPMFKIRIERINECAFLSESKIAYTTLTGELGIWDLEDKRTIHKIVCNENGAWLCGVSNDVMVVQASGSTSGYSAKDLKKLYTITTADKVLLTAVCRETKRVAVFDQSGMLSIASVADGGVQSQFNIGKLEYAQAWLRLEYSEKGDRLFMFLHSVRIKEHTTTKVINIEKRSLIHSRSDWHEHCHESICDAAILSQDPTEIFVASVCR